MSAAPPVTVRSPHSPGRPDVFEVLAEPARRRILDLLGPDERAVGDLVDGLGLSQPAVSKHLRVLREADLVSVRVDAQRRWYRVNPLPLRTVDDWLAPHRRRWSQALDALERHLDALDDGSAAAPARTDGGDRATGAAAIPDQSGDLR